MIHYPNETIIVRFGDIDLSAKAETLMLNYLKTMAPELRPLPTNSSIPRIGEFWKYQGGLYAGIMRGEKGLPDYHLIYPPSALNKSIKWGSAGKDEPGAASDVDGLANTLALVESKHDHPAAKWAHELTIEGHHDFYLPARHEVRLMYINLPGVFQEGWHWTSTQHSNVPGYAWFQDFDGGNQSSNHEDGRLQALAVRRLIIQ